jgi:Tol biopolymer transport system component
VLFVDRPASRPVGIYGVNSTHSGPPTLVTERIVNTAGGGAFLVYPEGSETIVERAATGERYVIPSGGRPVSVSPDGQRSLWQVFEQRGDFDRRRSQTWVANVDGSDARVVAETVGVSQSQWIGDRQILLVGLPSGDLPYVAIANLTLGTEESGDQVVELAQVARPRGTLLSPRGHWLIYYLTFQSNPSDDGLWVVPTDGSRPPRKLDFFGSYRWRDDDRLLYVPMVLNVESHVIWEHDVVNGVSRRLTDPAQTSFRIANGDWAISPDGRRVVFVKAADHNLWMLDLEPSSR